MEKCTNYPRQNKSRKLLAMACFVLIFLTSGFVQATNGLLAQTVTANFRNVTLNEIIWEIQKQTNFTFIYSTSDVQEIRINNLNVNKELATQVLDKCLKNSGLTYTIHNGVVAIKKATPAPIIAPEQQKSNLKGKIVDVTGEGIPGANVVIKGTQKGAITDMDGNFAIEANHDQPVTLIVSFIGYEKQEVKASPSKNVKVTLKEDANALEEVVVTGYGTFKKSAYAGSASIVKSDAVKDVPNISFQQMLEGSTPGVSVTAGSGIPGSSTSIRIRGMGSFNASNSPLYVVDGIPVLSGDIGASGSDSGLDVMTTLNTSDIESVTVIKDAAAASLYGSRAANGVVIITTKQGKSGKPIFSLKADWGFSDFAMDFREMMGGQERRDLIHEGLCNYALTSKEMTDTEASAYADANIDEYAPIPWCGFVDWNKHMFQTGRRDNYELSISGGQDKLKYYTSIGYMSQEGVSIGSGIDRISGRLNVDYQMADWMTLGAKILFSTVNQDTYSEGTGYTAPIYSTRNGVTPSDAIWNEDGSWNRDLIKLSDRNPLLSSKYNYKREAATRSFNTVYASFKLYKELKLNTTFSYDFVLNKSRGWKDPRTSDGDDDNGRFSKDYNDKDKMVWSTTLAYQKTFAKHHNVDVLAGYEIDNQNSDGLGSTISNFARADKVEINNGVKYESMGGSNSCTRIVSYLTRLNYDYASKYYAGASWRTDGSSRLARENRWGNFWSLSGAWRVSSEKFMKPTASWLTDLKLRASYGVNGTLPSTYYGYLGLSSLTSNYNNNPGISQTQLENKDLSWETNYNFNSGLDISLWNRFNITLEYYQRTTKNLLYARPISVSTGFTSYLSNIGKLSNKGVELEIQSKNISTKDFNWTTSLNLGHNRNKILRLDGVLNQVISGVQIHKVGKSYSTYYLREFAGIDPTDGAPQYYTNTVNADGSLDKTVTKDGRKAKEIEMQGADPTLTGGLSNNLRYKWFDLGFNLNFSLGGWSYDDGAYKLEHGGDGKLNIPIYYRERWQKEGDQTSIERFIVGRSTSMTDYATDRRLHSQNFLRLKSLTFGASLPKQWTQKLGIDAVRLFASGNNLLTWAAYSYYDPEAGSSVEFDTPPLRNITFGLEVKF